MPTHSWNLDDIYYQFIKDGIKIYEIRVYDSKRKLINLGDTITFSNRDNLKAPLLSTKISEIKTYRDFSEALQDTHLAEVLPNVESFQEGLVLYESFPHQEGTYKEGAEKYGVIRFKFDDIHLI